MSRQLEISAGGRRILPCLRAIRFVTILFTARRNEGMRAREVSEIPDLARSARCAGPDHEYYAYFALAYGNQMNERTIPFRFFCTASPFRLGLLPWLATGQS